VTTSDLSSCPSKSLPDLAWNTTFLRSQAVPMGKWVWNSLRIFLVPFPSWWSRVYSAKQVLLNYMSPQAGLGRHQKGNLNSYSCSMIWFFQIPWYWITSVTQISRGGFCITSHWEVLETTESQVHLRRTLCLIQEMPSSFCPFLDHTEKLCWEQFYIILSLSYYDLCLVLGSKQNLTLHGSLTCCF
jgi:hypothetical protein